MPRLKTFKLRIHTGQRGLDKPPQYTINGFPLPFDEINGEPRAGSVIEAVGHPESYPHTLTLNGPTNGAWDIEGIEAEYDCDGEEPYRVRLGAVTLDDRSDLNLWYKRTDEVFDV